MRDLLKQIVADNYADIIIILVLLVCVFFLIDFFWKLNIEKEIAELKRNQKK